ncbi:MAG: lysophospholipid acyltransferase family protein [Alphaproteobacteria bacterium]
MEDWKFRPAADHGLSLGDRLKSLQRETGLIGAIGRFVMWLLVRLYLRVYHRLRIRGRDNLPAHPPFVLVANHASHLDALVLAACLPLGWCDRTFALAAGDTFFTSLSGSIMVTTMLNALPIWRKRTRREHLQALRSRLLEQSPVYILFPEGTRSRDGRMASFKAGLGPVVAGTTVPVVPCHIAGAFDAFPPSNHWPRPHPLGLAIGRPLHFAATGNTMDGWTSIATALEESVRALANEPERDEPPAP